MDILKRSTLLDTKQPPRR